ncbi:MAG: PAS domain-containing protein [Candidatus Electryonea clarkiae]|nr:PAS domain-containing protein [Candidatus Electryonea clarkiae]MDP8285466.1 PAS domain-containing protein [Candidatus Electryonea clarkiae]
MELPFEEMFDTLPCYISVQDKDLKVIAGNKLFREDFGDYSGRHCFQMYKNRPEKCVLCPVEKTFQDGKRYHSEEQLRCIDGRQVSVIVNTTPIFDDNGEITAVMEMHTDITEIKDLQKRFEDSQNRYRELFEEVPCFLSIQDEDLTIVDANRLHREAFGNGLGLKCYEVYKHRSEACIPCTVLKTFNDGIVHTHEEVVTKNDGTTMNVLVHSTPLRDDRGKVTNVIEMSIDITAIRELQGQLTSIGLLISTISHGIKGVLNGLDGGIYLVSQGLKKDNQARVEKGWEIVLRNVGRVRSMVLDILYYAKDREPNWDILSAQTVFEDVFSLVKDKAYDLGIAFENEIDENVGEFEADEAAMRSLLVNLSENSVDACRVDTKKEHHKIILRLSGSDSHILFEIEDNGIGMDRETSEKAFSLFFSSKGSEGTGLGLFIAYKIAKSHAGNIELKSEINKGTRFIVSIPRKKTAEAVDESVWLGQERRKPHVEGEEDV